VGQGGNLPHIMREKKMTDKQVPKMPIKFLNHLFQEEAIQILIKSTHNQNQLPNVEDLKIVMETIYFLQDCTKTAAANGDMVTIEQNEAMTDKIMGGFGSLRRLTNLI
jgi:hypothetical protein